MLKLVTTKLTNREMNKATISLPSRLCSLLMINMLSQRAINIIAVKLAKLTIPS